LSLTYAREPVGFDAEDGCRLGCRAGETASEAHEWREAA
jgi:hypothetical protein